MEQTVKALLKHLQHYNDDLSNSIKEILQNYIKDRSVSIIDEIEKIQQPENFRGFRVYYNENINALLSEIYFPV